MGYSKILLLSLVAIGWMSGSAFAAASLNAGNTTLAAELISPTVDYSAPAVNTAYQPGGPVATSTVIKVSLTNGTFNAGTTLDICGLLGGVSTSFGTGTVPGSPNNTYANITLASPLASGFVYTIQDDRCAGPFTPLTNVNVPAGSLDGTAIIMKVANKDIPSDPNILAEAPVLTVTNQFTASLTKVTSKLDSADNMETFATSGTSLPYTPSATQSEAAITIISNESIYDRVIVGAGGGSCQRTLAAGDAVRFKITGKLTGISNIKYGVAGTPAQSYTVTAADRTNGYAALMVPGNNLLICCSTDTPITKRALELTAANATGTSILPGTRTAQITLLGGGNVVAGYSRDLVAAGTVSHDITIHDNLVLYDDFSGTYIDRAKWIHGEFVREIREIEQGEYKLSLKQASPNPVVVSSFPYWNNNNLNFSDPNSVDSIQADVAIIENNVTNLAYTRARLVGRWYNDGSGTPNTDMTGDIQAEVSLRGGPTGIFARWAVYRMTNPDGTTSTDLGWGDFTTPITLGTPYTLYISYDSVVNKFIFKIGTEEKTFGPSGLPTRVRGPNSPWKALNNRVQINDSSSFCYIAATFDNVYKNGSLCDDFSSSSIDEAKWRTYEFVREISAGKLRSKIRSSSTYTSFVNNELLFAYPKLINAIQAKVTLLDYQNPQGLFEVGDISGTFFNDGTPGEGQIGNVVGQVFIGGNGINPIAAWRVYKYTDVAGNVAENVASGVFTTPVVLRNTYTLFLAWDGNRFTFKFDTEEAQYAPVVSINPVNVPFKRVRTLISPQADKKEGTIEALFDDVMVEYKEAAWPMFMHDPQRSGRSPYLGPQWDDVAWVFGVPVWGKRNVSQPIIGSDGTIYVYTYYDDHLYAISSDGNLKWKVENPEAGCDPCNFTPAIGYDGTIYLPVAASGGGGGGKLLAFDPMGSIKLSYPLQYLPTTPAIGSDGVIYIGAGSLHAINPDGTLKWRCDEVYTGHPFLIAIGPDGTIYVPESSGLAAVNSDGGLKWRISTGWISGSPAVGPDSTIYLPVLSELWAISSDGVIKWRLGDLPCRTNDWRGITPIAIAPDGTVYLGNCLLYAVSPNGELKWQFELPIEWLNTPNIGSDGTIYIGSYSGSYSGEGGGVYAINADGTLKWKYTHPESFGAFLGSSLGSNGTLYVVSDVGGLYAFSQGVTPPLPGDCNGDGQTKIDEVQRAINQFLGISSVQPCCDLNGNGQVTIDEVQKVINSFLGITS